MAQKEYPKGTISGSWGTHLIGEYDEATRWGVSLCGEWAGKVRLFEVILMTCDKCRALAEKEASK
jgi:hypothetical protein